MNTAREKLRVAKCIESLPLIDEAFKNADVSYSKVRAMTRVATPENEGYLLYICKYGTASHIEQLVRKYKKVQQSEAAESIEDEYTVRDLSYYQDNNGMWVIKAKLPMVEGGLLINTINDLASKKFAEIHCKKNDQNLDIKGKNVSAETFSDLVEGSEIIDKPNMGQIKADILADIAEHYITTATKENGGAKTLKGHERCQVVLHVGAKTFENPNLDGQWITPENAKRFSCDASIITAYEDEYGNVLNIGRNARTVPPNMAKALNIRDETCRYPGCCESTHVDFHHIQHWSNGGETNPDNLVKLCRFHHRALHSGVYSIERLGSNVKPLSTQHKAHFDTLVFKTSSGLTIDKYPKLEPCRSVQNFFSQQWPNVTVQSGKCEWTGESMDYSMGIDALLWRDRVNISA